MKILKPIPILFMLLFISAPVFAKVTLPKIFSDNMVLQRNAPIVVWGWAKANEKVEISFNKQTKSATADTNGKWLVKLKSEKAGGPFELIIKGENTITIRNVLVGEVWLLSGQSNMEWTVSQSMNADKELPLANNSQIRQIKISKTVNGIPQDDFNDGIWKVSDPETTRDFSGVGYFFAKEIYKEVRVPIGLINSSWGGTNIETWISREGFESSGEFRDMIARMPKLEIAELSRSKVGIKQKEIEAIQGVTISSFNSDAFKRPDFDDSKLPSLELPKLWEEQSLGQMDGVVWLRKTITLNENDIGKPAALELAKIDDNDVTFINGVEIGRTNQWDADRKYPIPVDALKAGKNIIAVRVTDTGGGGGIYGEPADLRLVIGDGAFPLKGGWKFQVENIKAGTNENEFPSLCYNAMIHPLIPFSFRGVLWYQGESNAGRSYQYRKAFPLLINDWRQKWNNPKMPFYFVQLATYKTAGNSNEGSGWAELREAQTLTLNVPNTGMAVTTDIGDPKDIHPRNKQDVGKRLAAHALNRLYGKRMTDSGPGFKSMKTVGNKIIVSFENTGSGLSTTDVNGIVKGFEIAGKDQIFYEATGIIKGNTVILTNDKVTSPIAVRFGWIGDASANNLFNKEGFPAIPFRTDDWKTVTKEAKYKITEIK